MAGGVQKKKKTEQIKPLTGAIADEPHLVNSLIYLAQRHHGEIIGIDTVRVYYLGYKYAVELDIILHPDTLLRKAHDIGESLQNKLEKLFMVSFSYSFPSNPLDFFL